MKRVHFIMAFFVIVLLQASLLAAGRRATVEWSDGKKITGDVSLSPGKEFRIFVNDVQTVVRLEDIREISVTVEKEEIREGFTFPEAGKAIKEKTGEVYPVRYLLTQITLESGKIIKGHLFTTTLYAETESATLKVILYAKQTGKLNQKVEDIVYPSRISFEGAAVATSNSKLDLANAGLGEINSVIVVSKPSLAILEAKRSKESETIWDIPNGEPNKLLFAVICKDGIHMAWPDMVEPDIVKAVETSIKDMPDFYDTSKILGCFAENENTDVYSLVLLSRSEKTHSFEKGKVPWTIAVLRWKYDPEERKTTLLNRVQIATGREQGDTKPPQVFKEAGLLKYLSADSLSSKGGTP